MSDDADRNNEIAMFMEISGTDFETAKQTLIANNYNLEQAINYHLERTNALNAPENDVAAASTSTGPNLPVDDEEVVRPPILPKREQLILPNEDNFRYRKRRTAVTRSVCPLRNFELEGQIQEERLQAAVLGNFIGTHGNNAGGDPDSNAELDFIALPTAAKPTPLGFSNATKTVLQSKLIGQLSASSTTQPTTTTTIPIPIIPSTTVTPPAPSRLSELFRPPVDINFCGSFQAVRDYAKEQNRWLIVNVQDMNDFSCQVLNRDIWSSGKLREIIKKYFIFWQVAIDNTDGHRFQVFYDIKVFPYIGVIDPRTGEEKLSYKTGFKLTLKEFIGELGNYLKENTPHPNADSVDVDEGLSEDFDGFNAKPTISLSQESNNHVTASPRAKRKRLEPSSLSEQEQIALAIGNSLREVNSAEDKSDSYGEEDDDDESDFDNYDDEESSNQSYVKSQTPQNPSIKSIPIETNEIEPEIETEHIENGIESIEDAVESYESYLGDESDPIARIQLRLPNGDRHILEWPCTSKLKALKLYIPFKYPDLTNDNAYKVIFFGGQSSNVLDMEDVLTLKEANLYPTVILHLRNDD